MKFTAILIFIASMHVSANGYGQRITIIEKNAKLQKVFAAIEAQTQYVFFYDEKTLQNASPVTIHIKNVSLQTALDQCFQNQPMTYSIVGLTIVVKRDEHQVNITNEIKLIPHLINVYGQVLDDEGNAVVGATILNKITNVGVITDNQGKFTISVSLGDVLIVSSIGFVNQELKISSTLQLNSITIKLIRKTSRLDDVQVIAYGQNTQRFNVGSVSKITTEELSKQPVSNLLAALEAKTPGLEVIQSNGLPGSSFSVQIRGQNSIRKNPFSGIPLDNPLFIIDGVPFAPQNENINQFNSVGAASTSNPINPNEGISPFNVLNISDIESVEILRDADATAIYGSRAANGVVLITTKKGKVGKTQVNGRVISGVGKVTRTMEMMNTSQYLAMRREAFKNDGIVPTTTNAPDLLVFDTTRFTDWKKYFLGGTSSTLDATLSISGGTSSTQFYAGTNYHREGYIFPGKFYNEKKSFSSNIRHKTPNEKFEFIFSTSCANDNNNSALGITPLRAGYLLPPNYPSLTNDDGSINWNYKGVNLASGSAANPLVFLRQPYSINNTNFLVNTQININITRFFTFKSFLGYNSFYSDEHSETPRSSINPTSSLLANAQFGSNNFKSWNIEPQLLFHGKSKKLDLQALLGMTFQRTENIMSSMSGSNYLNDALLGSIAGAGVVTSTGIYSLYKYAAGFGRFGIIHDKKYILNLTFRRDGSSRFGPNKQFGNFGSIATGWIFTQEQFLKVKGISYGKLHASFGTSGNDNIGNYQYLSNWRVEGLSLQGSQGLIPQNLFNQNYSWAVNKKVEAGIELGFLNDQILFSGTWYRHRCGNQLVSYQLPIQTGFASVTRNFPGVVQNTGLEFQLSSTVLRKQNLSLNFIFNLTIPRNKLVSFPGIETSSYANFYQIGKSLSLIKGYSFAGVNDTSGVYQFYNSKGERTYSPAIDDMIAIGNRDAKYFGNFGGKLKYKKIELFFNVQFNKKIGFNYLGQLYNGFKPGFTNFNQPVALLERWTQGGDPKSIQRFSTTNNLAGAAGTYFFNSSGAYSDASYIRLKTLSLSYSISAFSKSNTPLDVSLFVNAQNVLTVTKYKGNDPETLTLYGVPPLRIIAGGIQIHF